MADSDTPLFRDRPELDASAEEPLGLKNPLLPARSLGLNQRFLVPLGAQSLSVLDASIFQSDSIQRDILDSPFQDSPFFSDADLTSISVGAVSVDAVSVDGLSSQGKKAQDAIQLQQSPAATLGSTLPEPQVLRNEVSQSEEMQGQRSQLPAEPQQSTSEPDIQRSPDKAFAPSSENISESPDQPQQLTSQSNNPALNVEATQQTSSGKKEQPSFSETRQIKETQPSSQPLQAEAEIQLSQDKISSLSSEKVSAALVQPQKSINQSSEPELDSKPEYRSTPSENIQLFASSENKIQIPQTLQSSDQETQLLQEISLKQSSDASIQPQQLSSQFGSLELNNLEPNSLEVDGRSIQQINTQKTDVSENSQSHFADEINLESPQSGIQPSRSHLSSERSSLDSTQPVHNLDIAAQPNSELPTFNLEQVVPSNHVSPIQKTSEHDEIALATSAERSANPLLQTANEIIQSKIIVSNNSANDEILTNIDNTVQQSASNAIASSSPVDSIATTSSKSQLENNESVLQQSPISVQAQALETTEIKLNLANAASLTEAGATEVPLEENLEATIKPTIQTAEESAIAPKFDLQSIENPEATQPSLDSISTENLNSSATTPTYLNDLSNSSNPLSTVLTSALTESNQSSELALSNFQQAENAPMIQPQLAENDAKEITQLATTPSPSSEELEVSAPSTRSLQPTLEATREPVLQQQPESITDTADNELSLLQRSPIAEQSSSEEMLVASEAMTEPSATKIEPLVSEVSPVVSRAVDLSFETANSNGVEIEPISLEAPLESQAESLQLKALTESADSLDTNAQVSNSPQALNESSDTGSNPQAQENVSNQISVDAVQQLSRSVDDVSEQKTGRSQNRLEQTQALPKNESVISENLITSLAPIAQELQLDSNESIQRTSEITSASSSVAPIETTEMGDRAANQNFPEIITEQSSPVDLNTSEIVDSVASKDSLQATVSIHEPSMVDVSKSVLSFGNAFTQATIEQSRISEPQVAQPIQRSPQSFLNQADSITADSVVNLATTSADEVLSQLTQDDTFQSSNIVNQTNIPSEIGSTSEEAIQRTIQQSEIGSANIEENTQQEIQKSQPQVDSEQIKLESFIQRSPTLENTAIASPTQPQIIQVKTSELPTLQSDFTSAENSNSPFINQAANPQITSEPSVNQMIDLRSDRAVQADVANLMQPNTSVEQPTTIIQAKPDIQPNQAIDDRAPSAIDIQSLVQKAITEPAAIQLQQTTDNRMSSAIDVTPTSTPSIHPSAPLFDSPSSIPETAIQRSLESLDTKPNSPAIQTNQPDSIPELPQVLQNLTVLRSLTQPQPLGGSDATVQAKSLQSQSLQATPRQAISTTNLPLVSAIPTANVPAASSIEQSVLNRKPEPVKVASTSSDRLSRQWSTLNELVQGQTVPSRRTSVAKPAPSQKPSSAKVTNPTIQAKLSESSTPVRVTRQSSPTIRREGNEFQDEDFDDIDYLEALAQAIYDRLRQRMRIEQERHGRDYSGRLPW